MTYLLRRTRGELGFGLVETIVAIALLTVVFGGLASVSIGAFRALAQDRETQSATQLAQQTLEQTRAIAFNTLRIGIPAEQVDYAITNTTSQNPLTTATKSGDSYYYRGEQLITTPISAVNSTLTQGTALNPFQKVVTVDSRDYLVSTYPTCYEATATATPACPVSTVVNPTIRVTVVVSWVSLNGSRRTIENESLFYSPSSCLSPDSHPFSSPCQAYFYGTARVGGGIVTVRSDTPTGPLFHDADAAGMSLLLPEVDSALTFEQVASATSTVTPVGIGIRELSGANTAIAGDPTVATVSTDPAKGGATTDSRTVTQSSTTAPTVTGDGVTLTGTAGAAGGASVAVTAASTGQTPACTNQSGNAVGSGKPCASSYGHATADSQIALTGSRHDLALSSTLVTLVSGTAEPRAYSTLYTSAGVGVCGSASATAGCAAAGAAGPVPTLRIGGIPAGIATPPGWPGYFLEVSGLSPNVVAQQLGGTAVTPTVSLGTPVLKAWGNADVPLTASVATQGMAIGLTPLAWPNATDENRVVITPSLSYGSAPATSTPAAGASCAPGTPCTSTADASSVLTGTIRYEVFASGDEVLDLYIDVTLRGATASATYQAAPLAG